MKIPKFVPSREAGRLRCIKRHKSIKSTPEELVRQRILDWLKRHKKMDLNNIKLESSIRFVTGDRGRADIILFSEPEGNPSLLIECKKAGFRLGIDAVRQAKKYANKIECREALITNGNNHRFFKKRGRKWIEEQHSAILDENIAVGRTPKLPVKNDGASLDKFMRS